jgi:glycosyltransferase involved in cell wall biosynthesis
MKVKDGVRTYRPGAGEQLDFSSLPKPVGDEWSRVLGHRQKVQLNVLEVVHAFERVGGLETYLHQLNTSLMRDHRVNIHVLYATGDPGSKRRTERVGESTVTLHPLSIPAAEMNSRLKKAKNMAVFGKHINELLKTEDIDVVNLHSVWNADLGAACGVALLRKVPLVITSHGEKSSSPSANPAVLAGRALKDFILGFADRRVGVSLASAKALGDDSIVLGSLCDTDFFRPDAAGVDAEALRREIAAGDGRILLYPARIQRAKGQLDFAKACAILRGTLGGGFKAVIVGPVDDAAYARELSAFIGKNQLEETVYVLPETDMAGVRNMYAASDAVVFPSYMEGLGLTAVESLAMKKPVVAYRSGGIPEIVRDGRTGILVNPGDVKGLSDGVLMLLDDSELSRRFGENGREIVVSEFSPRKLASRYMALYKEIIRA